MINEDFSIKTGIEVDDNGVDQLKNIADELEKTAKALQKINNVKFNGDIFSGLVNAGKNIQNVTKEIDKLQKSANGVGKPLTDIGKGAESIVSGNSKQFTLLDLASIDVIKSSMNEITTSAQNLKETLGSEVTSGLMTQINEMLAKKDELQNLANILKSNKEDLNKSARATGNKKNKNSVPADIYNANYKKWQSERVKSIENEYPGADIIGAKISQTDSGLVKLSASIRTAEGEWKKYNVTVTKTGEIIKPSIQNMTDSSSAEKAFQKIKAGKLDPKDFLNFDEAEIYARKLNQIFEEAYGTTEKYTANVEADGQATISKTLPSGEEITVMRARVDDVRQIVSEYEQVSGNAVKVKELVEKSISSVSAKVSPVNKKTANNTTVNKEANIRPTTDKSLTGDLKYLLNTEAEDQIINKYIKNTKNFDDAISARKAVEERIKNKTATTDAEKNAEGKFHKERTDVLNNIQKYDSSIQKAYDDLKELQNAKQGISGIETLFASGEKDITKWAASVAKGKMSIEEFEKKVNGLKASIGNVGKIIDPASITDAKGELESYLREFTGLQNIDFSGYTSKNGIASLKGTFKDSAGEAHTLSVQLNTLDGQIKNLGESVKPVESGISKFFSGWKTKMVNLAQYLTSFQAMNQVWNTFKQGLEVVKEFDTALTEMRKVSDEPISKLKEFQKESFDMAKSVGTTALQIQNSTADFQRLGESFSDAKQSSVNANKLLNVSEFDNIDDATSALISMKAAYSEVAESDLVDKVNQVGEMIVPKHMVTCGEFLYSL